MITLNNKSYISKSDFKLARDCATKIYYKKMNYENSLQSSNTMQMLAEGGHVVGAYAQLLYPNGILIDGLEHIPAAIATQQYLENNENITLFEAAIFINKMLVRIDILHKIGNNIELIEVKSKGISYYDGVFLHSNTQQIVKDWQPYIEDISYQTHVFSTAYPKYKVNSFLLLPNKNKPTNIDLLPSYFKLTPSGKQTIVQFVGDNLILEEIRKDPILCKINVDKECGLVLPNVLEHLTKLLATIDPIFTKASPEIGYKCKNCEFATGRKECWGSKWSDIAPITELYQLNSIKVGNQSVTDYLIENSSKVSYLDITPNMLTTAYAPRQYRQIECTRNNTEYINQTLGEVLNNLTYPLHFIDFETIRTALPLHLGMRSFEQNAFQWSLHTLTHTHTPPTHMEWLNTQKANPNKEFITQLKNSLGDKGTVLTWSHHESSTLLDIIENTKDIDMSIKQWYKNLKIIDMCKLTQTYYYHPLMHGSVSIKAVLPAILPNFTQIAQFPWLQTAIPDIQTNPYKELPEYLSSTNQKIQINEGTMAIQAYIEILLNNASNTHQINSLKNYCKLDTLAMIVIFLYWHTKLAKTI